MKRLLEEEAEELRHCELCGGESDGKPPPHMVVVVDLNELHDGFGHEHGWLGRFIRPIAHQPRIFIHYQCLLWTPEVHLTESESWKNVESALTRGKSLKCTHCTRRGATLGCRIDTCDKTYHLACARFNGCKFDHNLFLMACPDHAHMFQQEQSDKGKGKHPKSGCDDNDDDSRIHRKFGNIVPTFVGGIEKNNDHVKLSSMGGWESVGGLQQVIDCMKEVILLPMLYPEFFTSYAITPPRGVLLHGYPGTGKTHVVRALVASCARGDKRIAYFACKGADCLSKYVGDSEKHLKHLFQLADECQPSIIFFDEIDGLAPSRTQESDQTHNSVVTTLLSLLDGIKSRGSVVVIGATNRPNAIDPALRRPGRFDREVYFPLPSLEDRISILSVYTQKWPKPPKPDLVPWIATKTAGFAGADLKALCTETVITALKRKFPLKEALSEVDIINYRVDLSIDADVVVVEERDWLEALSILPPPCSRRNFSAAANDIAAKSGPLPSHLISCFVGPLSTLLVSLYMEETICLPNTLLKAANRIKSVMVSTLKKINKKFMDTSTINRNKWWVHVDDLIDEDSKIAKQITKEINMEWQWQEEVGVEDCNLIVDDTDDSDDENCYNKRNERSFILEKSDGFGVMIAGNSRCGQRHLATCILNSYREHVEIRKLDLITLVTNPGFSSLGQAMAITLADFQSRGSCLIYMPRLDLWAIHELQDPISGDIIPTHSSVWNIFSQQVDSLSSLSTPFIFLATSDVPFSELPEAIKKFFGNDLSKCKYAGQRKNRIPRFSIQVDHNFNRNLVLELSASKLCNDLVKLIVELIHNNNHQKQYLSMLEHISSSEEQKRKLEDAHKLLVSEAISSFGYEILNNSKFSTLCNVTSKFKSEEIVACASISESEWKEWKFNSCVVVHGDDNNDVVKGLIAVGLLATRGVYTTLHQVCCDVKNIIDVLVEKVNVKVDDGKDKRRYLPILSHANMLQDVVDSWAHYYKLKSLKLRDENELIGESDIICSMNCCSGCVDILHVVTRKIVNNEFESSSKRFDGSIESVDEIVMRKWVKLAKKVIKSFVIDDEDDDKMIIEEEDYKKLVERYGMESCECKMRTNYRMQQRSECTSHIGFSNNNSSSVDIDIRNKFVFKNNILVAGIQQHHPTQEEQQIVCCNYNALCLASFIHLIAIDKKNNNNKEKSF